MKSIKYLLFIIFYFVLFIPFTQADTCSYKEQTTLNTDLVNIKITYEIIDENQVNIMIYNITNNIFITYNDFDYNLEQEIFYSNTTNGKYVISRNLNNVEEYKFEIRSNISSCYGNILSTKRIIKPKYNEFHNLEICQNQELSNHTYCQEYVTQNINKSKSDVIKTLEEFLETKVGEFIKPIDKEENVITVKEAIIYSGTLIIIVTIIVAGILIYKKRGEL